MFAIGLFLKTKWAWTPGVIAVVLNVLLVVNALTGGEPILTALIWLIIPIIIVIYLFSDEGRRAFHDTNP